MLARMHFLAWTMLVSFAITSDSITPQENPDLYRAYRGCGFTKTCLKICLTTASLENPCRTCIRIHNCPALVTIRYEGGMFHSQLLLTELSEENKFIAMGIAYRKTMLNSPYVSCCYRPDFNDTRRIVMFSGATTADYTEVHYYDTGDPSTQIFFNKRVQMIPISGERPALLCEFTWRAVFSDNHIPEHSPFDLNRNEYFIIAATGPAGDNNVKDWAMGGHAHSDNGRRVTDESLLLSRGVQNIDLDYDEDYDCEDTFCGRGHSKQCCFPLIWFSAWVIIRLY